MNTSKTISMDTKAWSELWTLQLDYPTLSWSQVLEELIHQATINVDLVKKLQSTRLVDLNRLD